MQSQSLVSFHPEQEVGTWAEWDRHPGGGSGRVGDQSWGVEVKVMWTACPHVETWARG